MAAFKYRDLITKLNCVILGFNPVHPVVPVWFISSSLVPKYFQVPDVFKMILWVAKTNSKVIALKIQDSHHFASQNDVLYS